MANKIGVHNPYRGRANYYTLSISGVSACQLYLSMRKLIPLRHLSRKWDNPDYVFYCNNYINEMNLKYKKQFPKIINLV